MSTEEDGPFRIGDRVAVLDGRGEKVEEGLVAADYGCIQGAWFYDVSGDRLGPHLEISEVDLELIEKVDAAASSTHGDQA